LSRIISAIDNRFLLDGLEQIQADSIAEQQQRDADVPRLTEIRARRSSQAVKRSPASEAIAIARLLGS
jgi:hypothetical protein